MMIFFFFTQTLHLLLDHVHTGTGIHNITMET